MQLLFQYQWGKLVKGRLLIQFKHYDAVLHAILRREISVIDLLAGGIFFLSLLFFAASILLGSTVPIGHIPDGQKAYEVPQVFVKLEIITSMVDLGDYGYGAQELMRRFT